MRVLTVTADVPWPPVGGARTRNAHLLAALTEQHDVVVATLQWDDLPATAPHGIELHTVPWVLPPRHQALEQGLPGAWEALQAPDAEPYGVSWFEVPALGRLVADLCDQRRPDVVVLTETAMARFRHDLPSGLPWVLDLHDVHAVKQARRGDAQQAERLRVFEAAAAREASVTVCVSAAEAAAARDVLRAERVAVVPNGVDTSRFRPASGAGDDRRLVFTGSLHTRENVEGVSWFVTEVLPRVRRRLPGVHVDIVGAHPSQAVLALQDERVAVHANVPDTRPFLSAAGVALVPLLNGGGTRLKALEAIATRRAVVATPIGVEGLDLVPGRHLEVARSPSEFADAVVRLCGDADLRQRLADAALERVGAYDWRVIGRTWRDVVESAA